MLTEAVTWTNGDRFTISPDPTTLLNTFRAEQGDVISSQYDSAMLMTYVCLYSKHLLLVDVITTFICL